LDPDAEVTEKINELLGAVAALKAYVAHLPARLLWTSTRSDELHATRVNDTVDDIHRMASALVPATE